MDATTRRVLMDLKALTDTRKRMQASGAWTPHEIQRKIRVEEQMKYEITNCLREAQKKIDDKKKEEEKLVGQLTYKLERKIREMNRLKEEEDYMKQVEERYEARMKQEQEEKERKLKEREKKEIENDKKGVDKKEDLSNPELKKKKNRKKKTTEENGKVSEPARKEVDELDMKSLSIS